MLVFILRRLLQSVLVLVLMSMLVFAGVFAIGDPSDLLLREDANQIERARVVAEYGLDLPLWEQYLRFAGKALQGEMGNSFVYSRPAVQLILELLPATVELAVVAMLMSIVIGIPLGLLAGLRPDSKIGRAIFAGSLVGLSLSTFWVGLMLIMVFSVQLGWFPTSGRGPTTMLLGVPVSFLSLEGWKYMVLPSVTMALSTVALFIRFTSVSAREAMLQDYVRFARAKGLRNRRIIGLHVLKNIMVPLVTVMGLEFGGMIAFATISETIFSWPGVGKLLIDSIRVLDRPVVVAYMMMIVTLFILINLVVDIAYSLLDPRVRLTETKG